MSIPVPLKGFGGGGANLNFKIVGNPQPASPRENTIWIDTDEKITSWIFSATAPESPEEGMVWISIGTSSAVEFNALKKNSMLVYPLSAKQYVSGVWGTVEAQSYQGEEWIQWWDGMLYKSGDQYTDITGGWDYYNEQNGGSVTFDSDYITMDGGSNGYTTAIYANNQLDLAGYSTLNIEFDVTRTGGSGNKIVFGIADSTSNIAGGSFVANTTVDLGSTISKKVLTCDISSVDSGYVGIYAYWHHTTHVYRIWVE